MAGTKRVGVPSVQRPKPAEPVIPEKTIPSPKPASQAIDAPVPMLPEVAKPRTYFMGLHETYSHTERLTVNFIKNAANVISQNSPAIKQKAIVLTGAVAGMLISSVLVDRLGDRRPNVIVIGDSVLTDADKTENPDTNVTE